MLKKTWLAPSLSCPYLESESEILSDSVKKQCIAMILEGGQGSHLAALTTDISIAAIPFGACCRLIDFSLSNCYNSKINTVGIVTSQRSPELNNIRESVISQGLPQHRCNIKMLSPSGSQGRSSYIGSANAIYENIDFIEELDPEYVLILSGNHVYKMDYGLLLAYHKEKGADVTISVIEIDGRQTADFGIITTQLDGSVLEFNVQPTQLQNNLASMDVYIFSWPKLKYYLGLDNANPISSHDFSKNIIPDMLSKGEKIYAYCFNEYWRSIGSIENLFDAHMDLLGSLPMLTTHNMKWPIYSTLTNLPFPTSVSKDDGKSVISKSCYIRGKIENSIIFPGAYIGYKAKVKDSVIMPGAYIGHGTHVEKAIIGPGAAVENDCAVLGSIKSIAVVGKNTVASSIKTGIGRYSANQVWSIDQIN